MKKTGVILAGGKSSRMGFDKQKLKIKDKSIIEIKIGQMNKIFDEIVVVTNRKELYTNLDVIVISDIYPGLGPISGIHAVMKLVNSDYFYLTACDMPSISEKFIDYLYSKIGSHSLGAITRYKNRLEPLSAIYSKKLLERTEEQIKKESYKISSLVDLGGFEIIEEEIKDKFELESIYKNINTKIEYESYLKGMKY